jgi:hypothetical protein
MAHPVSRRRWRDIIVYFAAALYVVGLTVLLCLIALLDPSI